MTFKEVLGASLVDQWLRLMLQLQGLGVLKAKQGKTKWARRRGGILSWAFRGPLGLYFIQRAKLRKSLCTRVLDQICLLKLLMQAKGDNGKR